MASTLFFCHKVKIKIRPSQLLCLVRHILDPFSVCVSLQILWEQTRVILCRLKLLQQLARVFFVTAQWEPLCKKLAGDGHKLVAVPENLVDLVWDDQPPIPANSVIVQPFKYTGSSTIISSQKTPRTVKLVDLLASEL